MLFLSKKMISDSKWNFSEALVSLWDMPLDYEAGFTGVKKMSIAGGSSTQL